MPLTCDPNDRFVVELAGRAIWFKHLTARQARQWRRDLENYITPREPVDDAVAADLAAELLQPFVADETQLLDALPESVLVVLPMAFEKTRQTSERELGELCWRRIFEPVPVAADAATGDASTHPIPTGHSSSTT